MRKLFIFLFLLSIFLLKPATSFAEVIHSFDTQILAHKNGNLDFTETVNYDFESSYRHGIYRYIPLFSKVGNLYRIIDIKNIRVLRDGFSENYTLTKDKSNITFKIGNANQTINGVHTYKISYTATNAVGSNFSDHDEIYWNVTGNGWGVDIQNATSTVSTDFDANLKNIICFTGVIGSKEQNCTITKNEVSAQNLLSEEGLSIVAVYPVNTFPKSILSNTPPQTLAEKVFNLILKYYLYIWIIFNIFIAGALIYWYQKHKNKKRFGPPAVNFDIPKDEKGNVISPALAGTIDTAKLERNDVVSTLFDLAIRKYLKFSEEKTVRNLLPDTTKVSIIKLKDADAKLLPFEKELFDFVFEDGKTVDISTLRLTFYKAFQKMEDSVFYALKQKNYYTKNPKYQKVLFLILATVLLGTLNVFLSLVFFFFFAKLNGRTTLGDEVDFQIDGLKLFLKSMDRNYKWQVKNFYAVEAMIPYAIALGYIDKFMENLKINYPDYTPYWYAGYAGSFYSSYSNLSSTITTTVAPTSSSGAGGGGFSGGGGGGGGGGSW